MSDMTMERDERAFGPVAAAFLAAGIGIFVLGLLTTLGEANEAFAEWLTFSKPVGPLSGKTIIAVAAWAVSWIVLGVALRGKNPSPRTIYWTTGILVAAGLLLTFPSFFEQFAPEE